MKPIISGSKGQLTSAMATNMILPLSKYLSYFRAPVSPPPNTYMINSDFSPAKKRGFGFGSSRQEMEITGPLVDTIKNKNPGPGSYHMPSALERTSYSLGKKYCKEDLWKKSIPGPGKCTSLSKCRLIHQQSK
jgi:hypothetical protein